MTGTLSSIASISVSASAASVTLVNSGGYLLRLISEAYDLRTH